MQEKNTGHRFVSLKELAGLFGVHKKTLKKELQRIKELQLRKMQRQYSPAQQEIIFKHLGSPYND